MHSQTGNTLRGIAILHSNIQMQLGFRTLSLYFRFIACLFGLRICLSPNCDFEKEHLYNSTFCCVYFLCKEKEKDWVSVVMRPHQTLRQFVFCLLFPKVTRISPSPGFISCLGRLRNPKTHFRIFNLCCLICPSAIVSVLLRGLQDAVATWKLSGAVNCFAVINNIRWDAAK